jgi:hypothetical protein
VIQALEQHVRECWRELAPGKPEPHRISFLKFSIVDYPVPTAALLFVVFADRSAQPVGFVKAARVEAGDASIQLEAESLRAVHPILPPDLSRVVPRLLRTGEVNGRVFLLLSALPGEVELHHTWEPGAERRRDPRLQSALRWACGLMRSAPAAPVSMREWLAIESPHAVGERLLACGWTPPEVAALQPRLEDLWEARWPAGPAHGDFFAGNLLFEKRAVSGVVDWGLASLRAPVFVDVLTYEIAFPFFAVYQGRPQNYPRAAAVHDAAPFVAARAELSALGVDAGRTSAARLAVLVAGVMRFQDAWIGRELTSRQFAALLRLECGLRAGEPMRASAAHGRTEAAT